MKKNIFTMSILTFLGLANINGYASQNHDQINTQTQLEQFSNSFLKLNTLLKDMSQGREIGNGTVENLIKKLKKFLNLVNNLGQDYADFYTIAHEGISDAIRKLDEQLAFTDESSLFDLTEGAKRIISEEIKPIIDMGEDIVTHNHDEARPVDRPGALSLPRIKKIEKKDYNPLTLMNTVMRLHNAGEKNVRNEAGNVIYDENEQHEEIIKILQFLIEHKKIDEDSKKDLRNILEKYRNNENPEVFTEMMKLARNIMEKYEEMVEKEEKEREEEEKKKKEAILAAGSKRKRSESSVINQEDEDAMLAKAIEESFIQENQNKRFKSNGQNSPSTQRLEVKKFLKSELKRLKDHFQNYEVLKEMKNLYGCEEAEESVFNPLSKRLVTKLADLIEASERMMSEDEINTYLDIAQARSQER